MELERWEIARRTAWMITGLAWLYVVVALWQWRPGELLIAFGVAVVMVPVNITVGNEVRQRRAADAAQSPFGPVRKFGRRP